MSNSIKKPSVGLCFIDTAAPVLSRVALNNCINGFSFDKVTVFTDTPELYGGVPSVQIPTLKSALAYGEFVIRELPKYIETDFILIAHYDGFILNKDQFSPHFYHYDYIGAPFGTPSGPVVGNGGFCWRSRKLCLGIQSIVENEILTEYEDLVICTRKRGLLESQYNCRFSSVELASHFSFEAAIPPYPTFGFHGAFHLPALFRENLPFLLENVPPRLLTTEDGMIPIFMHHLNMISPSAVTQYEEIVSRKKESARAARL